jgi:hypothetical protein
MQNDLAHLSDGERRLKIILTSTVGFNGRFKIIIYTNMLFTYETENKECDGP